MVLRFQLFIAFTERKKEGTIQYDYRKWEFMHECFPKHLRMGTAWMKQDKEIG